MKKFSYISSLVLLAAVSLLSACTDVDELRQPDGLRTYRMCLLADIDIQGAADTRAAYAFPDKSQIYVLFQQGTSSIQGTAVFNAASGLWTITPSQPLSEVANGSCRLSYFIDPGQVSSTSVAITQSTRIYSDAAATYTLSDDLLTVQGRFKPTLGRIRFLGKPGQSYTFTGLALATAFDRGTHTLTQVATRLTATCASDGYTPYFYATFADASARQLTFELDATTGLRRTFGQSVLQAGQSGYMTIPTAEQHEGWTLVNLSSGEQITMPSVGLPTVTDIQPDGATLQATIISANSGTISDAGFTLNVPLVGERRISCGKVTSLSTTLSDLSPETTYSVRAYATNEAGTAYSKEVEFTTPKKGHDVDIDREDWGSDDDWNDANSQSQTFTVNGVSFKMIKVESGTFQMGEEGVATPVHQVTLTNDYYIGETEVTQELWTAVMGSNPSSIQIGYLPVDKVSWNDCQDFITKLNELTGRTFRLPTEAEWEFAARGGNASQGYTYSGSNTIDGVAWYSGNSSSRTHEVATKAPNELGIYDMSGNVLEWCQDRYGSYSSEAQTNPTGPTSGSYRVPRGGSWDSRGDYCRVAFRFWSDAADTDYNLGLRLAL